MPRETDSELLSLTQDVRDKIIAAMIAAYKANGEKRYQGFYYFPYHVIRDLSLPWDRGQRIWKRCGSGDEYEAAHEAMMAEILRLRFAAVFDAVIAAQGGR